MSEWTVVTVITGLIGLFITVGKPILNLNKNLTALNISLEHTNAELQEQKDDLKRQRLDAHDSHQRLWDHNTQQDKILSNHETRISQLEPK